MDELPDIFMGAALPLPNLDLVDDYYDLPIEFATWNIGSGATVAASYATARARLFFLKTLYRLAPETTTTLATPEALKQAGVYWELQQASRPAHEAMQDAIVELAAHLKPGPISAELRKSDERFLETAAAWLQSPKVRKMQTAGDWLVNHVGEWQAHWHLQDQWISDAAHLTLDIFYLYAKQGSIPEGPLMPDGGSLIARQNDGKQDAQEKLKGGSILKATPAHKLIDVPMYLDDLKHPPYDVDGHELEDDGDFGTYNPRYETVKEAEARLLEELRPRLRRALESIREEDHRANGAMLRPARDRQPHVFDWLVRFQVLEERKKDIARDADVDGSHVRKAVKETADLIGLTLRKEKSGRPSGSRDTRGWRHIGDS